MATRAMATMWAMAMGMRLAGDKKMQGRAARAIAAAM